MAKTSIDVATEALRHIGVCGVEDTPEAGDMARAKAHLTDIFATLSDTQALAPDWTIETVPSGVFLPLSIMLAGSICAGYSKPEFIAEYKRGLGLVRDYELQKSRVDGARVTAEYF